MGRMKELDIRIRQGGDDAIAAVSELLPRWIPVSERLPEDERELVVLACGGGYALPSTAELDGYGLKWCSRPNLASNRNAPTHWMPLPEPPEVT